MSTEPSWPLRAFPNVGDGPLYDGLSKRELFAAMAMQGLLASCVHQMPPPSLLARGAMDCADALIAALSADEGQKP